MNKLRVQSHSPCIDVVEKKIFRGKNESDDLPFCQQLTYTLKAECHSQTRTSCQDFHEVNFTNAKLLLY